MISAEQNPQAAAAPLNPSSFVLPPSPLLFAVEAIAATAMVVVGTDEGKNSAKADPAIHPLPLSFSSPPTTAARTWETRNGDAAVVPLAGARVQPELRATPSSGSTVVPYGPRQKTNGGETLLFPHGVQTTTDGGDGTLGPR